MITIRNAELRQVCGITSTFPKTDLPEIAFAGRSNVGKSSLINTMLNRKALARTSSKPGKTQTINYYYVQADRELFFVDLPGYGYTEASPEVRRRWGAMIERYLGSSKDLLTVILLLDIRHAPTANDIQMYGWILENGFQPVLVATKLDKIKRSQQEKQKKLILEKLQADKDTEMILFSSETKAGREKLWERVYAVVDHSDRKRFI
ncbi:MAG: YihA family ribosome biogenesis GTP-binding protein [Eubacterium sp.]|nr:YihA family ribosome biogenesis GTP-binding protein [Eubacterium sp.]